LVIDFAPSGALAFNLCLARRLWVVGRLGIVSEHLRDDGTSDQGFQVGL
jgi:hypothetical protein